MFKKLDVVIIVILLVVSFIPELIFGVILDKSYNNTYAEITIDGKFYKRIPLSVHRGQENMEIKTNNGYNILIIKDNSIAIIDGDCKDKICIKSGYIKNVGESLICLPHKLMIEIKGNKAREEDVILAY
jgi:hypothetical protein